MQIINLEADISTPHLEVEMRTLRIGSGGTDNYPDLNNKPSINGITLVGDILTADLGIKTSELTNDSGYITTADIPTKTSDLINDSDFTTGSALTAAIAAVSADIPTTTSQLTNDSGFLTSIDIPVVPTKTSDLINDSGYITAAQAPVTTVNGLTGDVVIDAANTDYDLNNTIKDKIDALEAAIPTDTNDLTNGAGYITVSEAPVQSVNGATGDVTITVPTDTNDLTNGAGFITAAEAPVQSVNSQTGAVTITVPTDTNDLTNGAGYITAAEAPVQSVNGQTGAVVLDGADIEYYAGVTINSKIDSVEASIPTDTATIENVSNAIFQDGEYDKALDELIVNIQYSQAAGTPSPSAPLNITGWSNVEVSIKDDNNVLQFATNIPLGQTVGIGVLNVKTGELTITHAILEKTIASMNGNDSYPGWSFSGARAIIGEGLNTTLTNLTLNIGTTIGVNTNGPVNDTIWLPTNVYGMTQTQWMTDYPNLTVQIVLEYATPLTVTLTPTEVKSIIGYNNIYADSGDIQKLTYYKLTTLGLYNWVKTQI